MIPQPERFFRKQRRLNLLDLLFKMTVLNKPVAHFDERLQALISTALAEDPGEGDHSTLSLSQRMPRQSRPKN